MKEPVWCCRFQPSRVVSKPGSSQYTASLLWRWCNSSRYCTVAASSVRACSGRNSRWHRNVAKCDHLLPCWLKIQQLSDLLRMTAVRPEPAQCWPAHRGMRTHFTQHQSSSRIKSRWLFAALLTDEVENFLKTWLAVHNIMALFLFVFNICARVFNAIEATIIETLQDVEPSWGRRAPVFTRCEPDSAADRGLVTASLYSTAADAVRPAYCTGRARSRGAYFTSLQARSRVGIRPSHSYWSLSSLYVICCFFLINTCS